MKLKVSNVCQLFNKAKYTTETISGITWTNNNDGTITANGTATAESNYTLQTPNLSLGRKYLICGCPSNGEHSSYLFWGYCIESLDQGNFTEYGSGVIMSTKDLGYGNSFGYYMTYRKGQTATNQIWKPQLFDLTEMYGAGHEPTTVAQFRQDFPNEMYDYNPECWKRLKELRYRTETRNLFKTSNEVGTLNDGISPTSRNFEENKWYIGLSASGYYNTNNIKDFSIKDNLIYFERPADTNGYGIARAFNCEPNTTYTASCKTIYDGLYGGIYMSYFDKDGNILSFDNTNNTTKTITTPANCNWLILILSFYNIDGSGGKIYFKDIQLELGSTSTPYQPYGYLPLRRGKFIVNKEPVQLLDKLNYPATLTQYGVTFTNNGDGTITANGTPNEVYTQYDIQIPQFKEVKNDHKYVLFSGINDIDVSFVECIFWLGRQDSSYFVTNCAETKFADTVGFVIPQGEYPLYQKIALRVRQGYTANNLVFKPQLFDLTAMYGEGNEPTTVEQFRTDYPNEIYEYNPFNAVSFH